MILFYILLGYLLFRFVVGFLVPVFRTTKQMKEQFSQMNQPPDSSSNANAAGRTGTSGSSSSSRQPDASKVGEYIDFEEVKP